MKKVKKHNPEINKGGLICNKNKNQYSRIQQQQQIIRKVYIWSTKTQSGSLKSHKIVK